MMIQVDLHELLTASSTVKAVQPCFHNRFIWVHNSELSVMSSQIRLKIKLIHLGPVYMK